MPPKRKCSNSSGTTKNSTETIEKKARNESKTLGLEYQSAVNVTDDATATASVTVTDDFIENNVNEISFHLDCAPPQSPNSSEDIGMNSCPVAETSTVFSTLPENAVNIAVASRALFSLNKEHSIFEGQGLDEYLKLHIENEHVVLQKGPAFPFIQALQHVNNCLRSLDKSEEKIFNIVLMSHNHAQAGVRLVHSLQHYELNIQRVCLTGGTNPVDYLHAYNVVLYLTSYPEEVEQALEKGFAAAAIFNQSIQDPVRDQLRVAFDLDAVLFSADSESVFSSQGFEAFIKHEQANADRPITQGPLKEFASALGEMQQKFWKNRDKFPSSPIRTYIVSARSACVGERAIKTLRSWGLYVDELHFLSGAPKGPVLQAIKPHIFFDDSHINIESAQKFGTPAAHVRFGAGGYVPKPSTKDSVKCHLDKKMSFYNSE